jgi:hypothetical protein
MREISMKLELDCQKDKISKCIVGASTKPRTVTVPEEKDDAQLTLPMAISAVGDSAFRMFISTNKTFDKTSLAAQKLFKEHDDTVRTA